MSGGLFGEPEPARAPAPVLEAARPVTDAERERLGAEIADWKGKAQLWAVALAYERLRNRRLADIIRRMRRERAAAVRVEFTRGERIDYRTGDVTPFGPKPEAR